MPFGITSSSKLKCSLFENLFLKKNQYKLEQGPFSETPADVRILYLVIAIPASEIFHEKQQPSISEKKKICRNVSCGTMEFNWGSGFRGIQKITVLLHIIKDDLVFS